MSRTLVCGTGDLCNDLVAAGHRPVGVDFSVGMPAMCVATITARRRNPLAGAVRIGRRDRCAGFVLPQLSFFRPRKFFHECSRVPRRGGRSARDAAEPTSRVILGGKTSAVRRHRAVDRRAPVAQRGRVPDPPQSTAYLLLPGELVVLIESCGFTAVHRTPMVAGPSNS